MAALALNLATMQTSDPRAVQSPGFGRRVGSYLHLLIVLGIAIPVMVYLVMMNHLGWRTPMLGLHGALSYVSSPSDRVMLYAAPHTRTYFAGVGGNYAVLSEPWKRYFADRKRPYEEIQGPEQLHKQEAGVLILPSVVALSAQERTEILAFHARGGSVLATWATGTRDERGEWLGGQFLEALGIRMLGELPADTEVNHLVLHGESPLSWSQMAGQRLFLSKTSESLLRLRGEATAGRLMNWARTPVRERREEGGVVYAEREPSAGRVAAFAFAESTWESHPRVAYALIDDVLRWLQREPVIVRGAWPNGKSAAQVVEMDTEQGFENAKDFAAMMKSLEIPATFYVLSSVGKTFPAVMQQLVRDFEVGLHGDVHVSFKGQSEETQLKRIQTMRADLQPFAAVGKEFTGFRAPTEGYDELTEFLLQQQGFRHHTADPNRSEVRLPFLVQQPGVERQNALVVLPRTQRDDINLLNEHLGVEPTMQALVDDANLAFEQGALSLLSIHTQNFVAEGFLPRAMPAFLVHLKQRRAEVWLASAGEVAQWWRERERLSLSSTFSGKRLEFYVTVAGDAPLAGATLVVMLPQKNVLPAVQAMKAGMAKPSVYRLDPYRAAIVLPPLKPGNYAYQATFVN